VPLKGSFSAAHAGRRMAPVCATAQRRRSELRRQTRTACVSIINS
jgi:hypothetical protein